MVRASALTLIALLAACSPPGVPEAQDAIRATLKDPASAQFQKMEIGPDAVCGEFNAKNEMGGYVGFKPFAFVPSTRDLYQLGQDGDAYVITYVTSCLERRAPALRRKRLDEFTRLSSKRLEAASDSDNNAIASELADSDYNAAMAINR